ncbi:DUF1819 family protein [Runella slithyformis]|uniref:DUF1819 family protein n=1 Tax=Runella slithyformis (strain ATCC 29530 / DSM 19594 / LMG 11500 / NCIMB 11436 / LSU 4) TaxID=761193 RepID=A0A7U3ZNS7_RUNSL|nr:DUF1819 family protein [Runella slithyformis]AEI50614.1 Protein of unknown function DUF1819 putative inner membrane [Runella slithyformis DSM 19594]
MKKYTFSFTGASALIAETLVIAEEFERLQDWKEVQKSLMESNLLNKVKEVTFKREFSEIKKRLSLLTAPQLALMVHGSLDDAKAMILLSLVKAYPLIKDFITEVLLSKHLVFDRSLTESDYIRFFNAKSFSHDELNKITESTAKKVKQVVYKLLEQVGLITNAKNGTIIRPILSTNALDVIITDNPSFLTAFLFSNEEIKAYYMK